MPTGKTATAETATKMGGSPTTTRVPAAEVSARRVPTTMPAATVPTATMATTVPATSRIGLARNQSRSRDDHCRQERALSGTKGYGARTK